MITNITEFHTEYEAICKPAREALQKAISEYNSTMKLFITSNFCGETKFEEWCQAIWMDSHSIFDCGRDYVTETMILDAMISEIECSFDD